MADDIVIQAPKVPLKKRLRAFFFVLFAFAFWFLFMALARIVMKCALTYKWWPPNGWVECAPMGASLGRLTWPDAIVMIVTLIVAIWAARRLVFPPDD